MKQTRRNKILAVTCVIATAALLGTSAQANFADNWISQKSSTSPSYYSGGQRGYFNGGSFSARWPQSNDHLLTISKPSIKAGCGGIDMFLGGFSFLNADYLVQKLQRIMAAAPAAAFDIALKTLAPQVSSTIKELEAIVDKLNQLQLDDCKAAKALVATVASPFSSSMSDSLEAQRTSAISDFQNSSGLDADWKGNIDRLRASMKTIGSSAPDTSARDTSNASMAGCPQALKDIFGGGSILENIGLKKGLTSEDIASIRGFVGDAYVYPPSETGGTPLVTYRAPCDKSTYESLIDGTAQIADTFGACSDAPDTNKNLVNYVTSKMTSITTAIKTRSPISSQDADFLASIPLPVMPALRAAVQAGQEPVIIGKLGEVAARGLAYQMMKDMVVRIYQVNDYAKHAKSTQKNATDPSQTSTCQLTMYEEPFIVLEEVVNTAGKRAQEAYDGFTASAADSAAIDSLVASLEKFNDIVKQQMSSRFGAGAASRVALYR